MTQLGRYLGRFGLRRDQSLVSRENHVCLLTAGGLENFLTAISICELSSSACGMRNAASILIGVAGRSSEARGLFASEAAELM
jgi:hypothetical protein